MSEQEPLEINAQDLRKHLDRIHSKATASSESSGDLGAYRKQTADQIGCHKDALSMIERIDRMSPDKRADFLRSWRPMFAAVSPDWDQDTQDLLDRANDDADQMESEMA